MLNRIVLTGRLTADPEARVTPSGVPVATFRVAVDRPQSSESRNSGQPKETDFIDIVAWRQTAEFVTNYLQKGRLVFVDGRLQIREYVTQDGQRRKAAEVVADKVGPLDKPRDGSEGGGGDDMGYNSGGNSGGGGGGYEQRTPAASSGGGRGMERGGGNAAPPPARSGGGNAGRPAAGGGGRNNAPANDNFDDDMSDLSDPFAE